MNSKINKNRLLILGILLILLLPVSAQTPSLNQQKYWYYRDRFFKHFIAPSDVPGIQGTNIPADIRHVWGTSSNVSWAPEISWAEAPAYLAMYISTMATEYRLLKNNGQDYNNSLQNLINAMNAYLRIDANAEHFYDPTHPYNVYLDINGFFMRDDVPANFQLTAAGQNLADPDGRPSSISKISSGYTNSLEDPDNWNNEESMDMCWHLLLSMALVNKEVDAVETGTFLKYGNMSIAAMAREITRLIIIWMHNETNVTTCTTANGPNQIPNSWTIVNPGTCDRVHAGSRIKIDGPGSWAFGEAGHVITGLYSSMHFDNSQNDKVFFIDRLNWINMFHNPEEVNMSDYNVYCLSTIIGDVNECPFCDGYQETYKNILQMLNEDNIFEHLPLIFKILHHDIPEYNDIFDIKTHVKNLLNKASQCGFYFYSTSEMSDADWTTTNRLVNPEHLINCSYRKIGASGDYNGLDYMLLYNLYQLVYGNNEIPYNILVANNSPHEVTDYTYIGTVPIPIETYTVGNDASPETIKAQNSIESDKTVNSDGNLTLIAGINVHLKPGFHAVVGSNFHAYIDNGFIFHTFTDLYTCNGNVVGRFMQDTTTTNNKPVFSENEETKETKLNLAGSEINQQEYYSINSTKNETTLNNKNTESFTSSNVTSSIKQNATYSVSVYPNPNTGKFLVEINGTVPANTTVELRDLLGKTIYINSMNQNSSTIDLTASPAGIYFITVCAGKDCWLGKVVKE